VGLEFVRLVFVLVVGGLTEVGVGAVMVTRAKVVLPEKVVKVFVRVVVVFVAAGKCWLLFTFVEAAGLTGDDESTGWSSVGESGGEVVVL